MYRIREENLHEIYKKWPTKSIQRDFILFAKVRRTLCQLSRMRSRRCLRIIQTMTSSPRESRSRRWWVSVSTQYSGRTTGSSFSFWSQMSNLTRPSRLALRTSRLQSVMLKQPSNNKSLMCFRVKSVSFSPTTLVKWRRSRLIPNWQWK